MPRGRPRQFDTDKALDAALDLFWAHGYEGTSLAALAAAMGVNMPSLYAAFGNKEALFKAVVERYLQQPASYLYQALQEPTARDVAKSALQGAIGMVTGRRKRDGCLLVHGALVTSPGGEAIRQELNRLRAAGEAAVRKRFERSVQEGDLPQKANPEQLARYLMTVIWGLSVQVAGGASRRQLQDVADIVLQNFPAR